MNKLSIENPYLKLFIQYSLPILVIGIISRTFPLTGSLYFIVPVLLILNVIIALILIPLGSKYLVYTVVFSFPVYCLLTSVWSLSPIISLQRSLYFLLMYGGVLSSVLLYKKFYPDKGIGFLIPANILILTLSAISLIFNIPSQSWSGGNGLGFMGFAGHQNTLAAALLFTLPGLIAYGIEQNARRKGQRAKRLASFVSRLSSFILLIAFNVLFLILTYSRASILSLAVGIIIYLLITKSKKILTYLISATAIIIILYITIPFIQYSADSVLNKDGGRILDRRMILWTPSLHAAAQGGIFGLGYGVSAPDIKTPELTGSHFEDGRYVREKGNSVLAVIEETGWIGLIFFLLPLFYITLKISKSPKSQITAHRSLLTAALAAMLIHSQFEGWWVGVGSVSLPLYLIILFMLIFESQNKEVLKDSSFNSE